MRRRNPYADLPALLDATRKLSDEEMAELQLELGYTERSLLIYEQLLRGEPRNAFFRWRCEWLARLSMAHRPTVPRPVVRARQRTTTRRGGLAPARASAAGRAKVPPESSVEVRSLPIITVGQ